MHFSNDTDLYRVIGANIKYYREQANLTQVQLAEQAKISTSYLSKIEAAGCNKSLRSEERRVGKECRSRWSPYH